jgi:hypothetical protein
MLLDRLTCEEIDRTQRAVDALSAVSWAKPLLSRLNHEGGFKPENMPLLFEVRYAHELLLAGCWASYEYATKIGGSSVDFRTETSPAWLIELVSVRTSEASRRATKTELVSVRTSGATKTVGTLSETTLIPAPDDPDRSEEGEIIRAQGKIAEKVVAGNAPTKFPPVSGESFHMIAIDMRGFLIAGGDCGDYYEIAYGAQAFQRLHGTPLLHRVLGQPIKGLFDPNNVRPAARFIQERIHVLSFVCERSFYEGEIRTAFNVPNYNLFPDTDAAVRALETHPFARKIDTT